MWQSEDDIVKDLASLNDFGVPGDQEPYKFLYSIGRGSKVKQKKPSEKFVDSRTGEVINVNDFDFSYNHQSKGRGTLIGNFSKSKLQLQQQLRLARPLGSGDGAVESYYRRNRAPQISKAPTNPTDSERENVNNNITKENPRAESSSVETKIRVKAFRNSTSHCNALITNLLSKANANSNVELTNNNCSSSNSNNSSNSNDMNIGFSEDGNINQFNEFKRQESLINDFDLQNDLTVSKKNEEKDFLEKSCGPCGQSAEKKNIGVDHFEIFYYKRKEEETGEKERISEKNSEKAHFDADTQEKERQEKYRNLGERLNKLDGINSKVDGKAIYDFTKFSQCIGSIEKKSENDFGVFDNSDPKPFLYNEHDFPALRRN